MIWLGGLNVFEKILVANRGEIAVRIIKTCRKLGIKTVSIYSDADKKALHVKMADEAYHIGPSQPLKSYLCAPKIFNIAQMASSDAIHPGYGFFSENAEFARDCEKKGLTFIGPPVEVLEKMSDKTRARRLMREAGVPVIPGCENSIKDETEALDVAEAIGYPIMIKGVHSGGGRSIRLVKCKEELNTALNYAQRAAQRISGKSEVYVEKFIPNPFHVEVQLVADAHGNIAYLGERDCSIQRRHQKLIEEAPSPIVDSSLRKRMGEAAVRGAKSINYQSLGTMEFLINGDNNFYFIESNDRIQVEHPVTEMVTGIDLIGEQIRLAAGEKLGYSQRDVRIKGWAIECRINAEDPTRNFLPSPGIITRILKPIIPHIRIDSGVYTGYRVPLFYDSLISKVIAWGSDRLEAVTRIKRALNEYVIEGIKTTIPYHLNHWNGGNNHNRSH